MNVGKSNSIQPNKPQTVADIAANQLEKVAQSNGRCFFVINDPFKQGFTSTTIERENRSSFAEITQLVQKIIKNETVNTDTKKKILDNYRIIAQNFKAKELTGIDSVFSFIKDYQIAKANQLLCLKTPLSPSLLNAIWKQSPIVRLPGFTGLITRSPIKNGEEKSLNLNYFEYKSESEPEPESESELELEGEVNSVPVVEYLSLIDPKLKQAAAAKLLDTNYIDPKLKQAAAAKLLDTNYEVDDEIKYGGIVDPIPSDEKQDSEEFMKAKNRYMEYSVYPTYPTRPIEKTVFDNVNRKIEANITSLEDILETAKAASPAQDFQSFVIGHLFNENALQLYSKIKSELNRKDPSSTITQHNLVSKLEEELESVKSLKNTEIFKELSNSAENGSPLYMDLSPAARLLFNKINLELVQEHLRDIAVLAKNDKEQKFGSLDSIQPGMNYFENEVYDTLARGLSFIDKSLLKDLEIEIPIKQKDGNFKLKTYKIERFNLSASEKKNEIKHDTGHPIFFLTPTKPGSPPLIVARGTLLADDGTDGAKESVQADGRKDLSLKWIMQNAELTDKMNKLHEKFGKFKVCGHSLGGNIAATLSVRFPHLIESTVTISAAHLSKDVYKLWDTIKEKPSVFNILVEGDLVPAGGRRIIGSAVLAEQQDYKGKKVWCSNPVERHLKPFNNTRVRYAKVDIEKEERKFLRGIATKQVAMLGRLVQNKTLYETIRGTGTRKKVLRELRKEIILINSKDPLEKLREQKSLALSEIRKLKIKKVL